MLLLNVLPVYLVVLIVFHDVSASLVSRVHDVALRHTKSIARDLRLAFGSVLVSQQSLVDPQTRLTYCKAGSSNNNNTGGGGGSGSGSGSSSHSGTSSTRTASTSGASATASSFSSPYNLVESHAGTEFFNGWSFWTTSDPTHGIVDYVDESTGRSNGLVEVNTDGNAIMRVETTGTVSGNRQSIRITTESTYDGVLVIMDSVHMPTGCGTWPAWWSNGPNSPISGEIDIVEGVNDYTNNQASVHTDVGCSLTSSNANVLNITGTIVGGTNCAASETSNQGCGVRSASDVSFGAAFNENGGGVYAMKWDDEGIKIYFWPQGSVPSDVDAGTPVPDRWGTPLANWPSSACNSSKYFYQHSFIFDTTLCGDLAGGVWNSSGIPGQEQSCAARTGYSSCEDFVRAKGASFDEAFYPSADWEIKSVKFYELK
ncbi:glycoside hydrolase family 16 protein [Desarmillaria tabescens]|uniref:Glycoside hydrolase family 16 protein n=1 Tax=Armillaria tabescens TaxID=1929756 RepID=A0AA39JBE1_ARMTA|nr:glycoside hydrolase family 16 protein [Desarmillaria tabescens]KAK0438885.1 glycoside hydrolase family 16 protein [Desarmillaria tabescens]